MTFSVNDRLVLEVYVKEALKAEFRGGIATPGQKNGVKGLRVLVGTTLSSGKEVPAGSIAYIKEETLHNPGFAQKVFKSDFVKGPFIIAELSNVEFITTPDEAA